MSLYTDWLSGHRPTPREAAELCANIADALHHAHDKGVIHRDLKPGNLMIDRRHNVHLMDFGLAKRDAGEVTMTVDGQVLGTGIVVLCAENWFAITVLSNGRPQSSTGGWIFAAKSASASTSTDIE